jgi:hypothetical protein
MPWGELTLDQFVAPKCSKLTACHAPELPEPYNHFANFFLNNVLVRSYPDKWRWAAIVFLRRLANAMQAYRDGREQMRRCVEAPNGSDGMIWAYLSSLSHFESAIVSAYLALMAHQAVNNLIPPEKTKESSFESGENTAEERLNKAYNALKHFHGNLECGKIQNTTPIWLVDDGIECAGSEGEAKLRFDELTELLRHLENDARFLATEAHQMWQESRQSTSATDSGGGADRNAAGGEHQT